MDSKIIAVAIVTIILAVMFAGCNESDSTQRSTTHRDVPSRYTQSESAPSKSAETTKPDLEITSIKVVKNSDQSGLYQLIATVRNNGVGDADGFSGSCEYECPGGSITGSGLRFVKDDAGFIEGNSQRIYYGDFNVACRPPPRMLTFVCTIDIHNDVQETKENNNQKEARIVMP